MKVGKSGETPHRRQSLVECSEMKNWYLNHFFITYSLVFLLHSATHRLDCQVCIKLDILLSIKWNGITSPDILMPLFWVRIRWCCQPLFFQIQLGLFLNRFLWRLFNWQSKSIHLLYDLKYHGRLCIQYWKQTLPCNYFKGLSIRLKSGLTSPNLLQTWPSGL